MAQNRNLNLPPQMSSAGGFASGAPGQNPGALARLQQAKVPPQKAALQRLAAAIASKGGPARGGGKAPFLP